MNILMQLSRSFAWAITAAILGAGWTVDACAQQPNVQGLWTTGSPQECPAKSYTWSLSGDESQFRDLAGNVDAEQIVGRRSNGFITQTVRSPKVPLGTQWNYIFLDADVVDVRNLTNGRGFRLSRCPQPEGIQSSVVDPVGTYRYNARLQRWAGTWTAPSATIRITVVGNHLSATGDATWGTGASTNVGEFSGVAVPSGNSVAFGSSSKCLVNAIMLQGQRQALDVIDNGACGGWNVSFNGVYHLSRNMRAE